MKKNEKIEREIGKTLNCFDAAERLKVDPYFYTRLRTRIADEEGGRRSVLKGFFSLNVLRPAFLTVVLLLNILTAVMVFHKPRERTDNREQYLSAFAEEYSLDLDGKSSSLFE